MSQGQNDPNRTETRPADTGPPAAGPPAAGPLDPDQLDWAKAGGLIPAIIQDAATARVLMLGYMNRAALAATLSTGLVTFYSRGKQRLWQKGESSGHTLELISIAPDCDRDALLIRARPRGPTCHRGTVSCFD